MNISSKKNLTNKSLASEIWTIQQILSSNHQFQKLFIHELHSKSTNKAESIGEI